MKFTILCVCFSVLVAASVHAETATLKMRFVFDGKPPAPKRLVVRPGLAPVRDERLLVDPVTRGIRNVVVYVDARRSDLPLEQEKTISQKRRLVARQNRFDPHVVVARAGDTLQFVNQDAVGHAPSIGFLNNLPFGSAVPAGEAISVPLDFPEPAVVQVNCNICPWMNARLVIMDHPFVAVSDKDGLLQIEGLPVDRRIVFRVSHDAGVINQVMIAGRTSTWRRGYFEVDLTAGVNDLGEVLVSPSLFAPE